MRRHSQRVEDGGEVWKGPRSLMKLLSNEQTLESPVKGCGIGQGEAVIQPKGPIIGDSLWTALPEAGATKPSLEEDGTLLVHHFV